MKVPRSFGIHPWDVGNEKWEKEILITDLTGNLQWSHDNQWKKADIIGECGLDRLHDNWDRQMELFRLQLQIAEELNKPVVVHCVKAFDELISLRKKFNKTTWVVHGFTGSLQLAEQLNRIGIWVSFGSAILDERRTKIRECLRNISSPFMLETDMSDCGIEAIYKEAALLRNTPLQTLVNTIKGYYNAL